MAVARNAREIIVVLTGAGISAPSGLPTFRDMGGLWQKYRVEDVASPQAWARNPALVLQFYNERRAKAAAASPNAAHRALALLESRFDVSIVAQNADDLHERGGSSRVLHLHGELSRARSTVNPTHVVSIGGASINLGDCCPQGGQLRPHIVWFGEDVPTFDEAIGIVETADRFLVIGTSLTVYPAASLHRHATRARTKLLLDVTVDHLPEGFEGMEGSADRIVPVLVERWLG